MWSIHIDPRLPGMSDAQIDDHCILQRIASGHIKADSWVSHPSHTDGNIVAALKVKHLRSHIILAAKQANI